VVKVETCVILNGDYTFLNVVGWKRAIRLMVKQKAEVLKYSDRELHNCEGKVITRVPLVMKLMKIIRMIYKNRVPFSKKNIFVRDKHKCGYCGSNKELTVDHIIPASRGGKSNFENCITACKPCNNKKDRRTPSEAKMYLSHQPYSPTISEFIRIKMKQLKIDKFLEEIGVY
jgi:5-methylcytosine-specific restriction endonuclease McrA